MLAVPKCSIPIREVATTVLLLSISKPPAWLSAAGRFDHTQIMRCLANTIGTINKIE
jgi:hypothetical protein